MISAARATVKAPVPRPVGVAAGQRGPVRPGGCSARQRPVLRRRRGQHAAPAAL